MHCLTRPGAPHILLALLEDSLHVLEAHRQTVHILRLRILWHSDFPIELEVHNMDQDDSILVLEGLAPSELELRMEILDLKMLAYPVSPSH